MTTQSSTSDEVIERAEKFVEQLSSNVDIIQALKSFPELFDGILAIPADLRDLHNTSKRLLLDGVADHPRVDVVVKMLDKLTDTPNSFEHVITAYFLSVPAARECLLSYLEKKFPAHNSLTQILSLYLLDLVFNTIYSERPQQYINALSDIVQKYPRVEASLLQKLGSNFNKKQIVPQQRARSESILNALLEAGFDQEAPFQSSIVLGAQNGVRETFEMDHHSYLHFALYAAELPNQRDPHTLIEVLLEKGANWRRLLDEPTVSEQHRELLLQQPHVRKALLEEVRDDAQPFGPRAPQPMKM